MWGARLLLCTLHYIAIYPKHFFTKQNQSVMIAQRSLISSLSKSGLKRTPENQWCGSEYCINHWPKRSTRLYPKMPRLHILIISTHTPSHAIPLSSLPCLWSSRPTSTNLRVWFLLVWMFQLSRTVVPHGSPRQIFYIHLVSPGLEPAPPASSIDRAHNLLC